MRHSLRRITALAAACALGGTQGCMSYRAAPNGLKIDDRVRVAATTPLTLEVDAAAGAPGRTCLASEVRGKLISAHADTLTLASPLQVTTAADGTDCGAVRTVTLVLPAHGAEVGVQHIAPGRTALLVGGAAVVGFTIFMIIAIVTDPS